MAPRTLNFPSALSLPHPTMDQQPSTKHAAKMREMRDAASATEYAEYQFQKTIECDEQPGGQRDWWNQQNHCARREEQTESEQ